MERVPPSERTRKAIELLLREGTTTEEPTSELLRLGMRRILEEALEGEVRDGLGRGYYQRRDGDSRGYRNGYREAEVGTGEGAVPFAVPQVRDVPGGFQSKVRALIRDKSDELIRLATEMYARGLSTRDIEATFKDDEGRSLLSRTAVSEITESLWKEYEEFATRDLSDVRPLYLFMDGIAERLRPGARREAVLAAWALTWDGRKVLVHLAPGTKEDTASVKEFLQDLKRRGLSDPVLVVTDGAPGIVRAAEECFPRSLRQRCLVHRVRNILAKLPDHIKAEFRQAASAVYQAPSPAMARMLRTDLVTRYTKEYPSAVMCFEDDFEACIAHLRCPPGHRRVIRTTNLLERLFLEDRRRVNAAGTLFGERPVLKLMYAALIRASEGWRGIAISDFEKAQLERLRKELDEEHGERHAPAAKKHAESPPRRASAGESAPPEGRR